ncbi:MAG: MarR family transcriptional regulator [Pseudomonadota bacterium]
MTMIAHWNGQMDDARAETEFASIRPSDMRVFAQLRGRHLKLSAIHREMGFSRQAAQQAVDRLVGQGMIVVEPGNDSKRDKMVSITDKGQRWRSIAAAHIRVIEQEIEDAVGGEAKEDFRTVLQALVRRMRGRQVRYIFRRD